MILMGPFQLRVFSDSMVRQEACLRSTEFCFVMNHSQQLRWLLLIICIAAVRDYEEKLGYIGPVSAYSKFLRQDNACPKDLELFKSMERASRKIVLSRG